MLMKFVRRVIALGLVLGVVFLAFVAYVAESSTGPERVRYEQSKAEVKTQWNRLVDAVTAPREKIGQ